MRDLLPAGLPSMEMLYSGMNSMDKLGFMGKGLLWLMPGWDLLLELGPGKAGSDGRDIFGCGLSPWDVLARIWESPSLPGETGTAGVGHEGSSSANSSEILRILPILGLGGCR